MNMVNIIHYSLVVYYLLVMYYICWSICIGFFGSDNIKNNLFVRNNKKILNNFLTLLDFTLLPRCISNNKTLVFQLVKRNIAIRYRGSALGLVWSFVQPLMMLSIYTFVFSVIFKAKWGVDIGDSKGAFAIIMFCGLALYNIFSESVNTSCQIIISNPNFVKKVIFPLEILPLTQVLSSIILGLVWFWEHYWFSERFILQYFCFQ